jgi:hypothetical protein
MNLYKRPKIEKAINCMFIGLRIRIKPNERQR